MRRQSAFLVALFFAAVLPWAQAGTTSTKALNPQPLPPGRAMSSKVQVNPQPLPPRTQGGSAGIEQFANVTDRNIDRMNAVGRQGVARGYVSVSQPARPGASK